MIMMKIVINEDNDHKHNENCDKMRMIIWWWSKITTRFTFCQERTLNPMSRPSIWLPLQRFHFMFIMIDDDAEDDDDDNDDGEDYGDGSQIKLGQLVNSHWCGRYRGAALCHGTFPVWRPVSLPVWKLDKGLLKVGKSQISSGFLEIAVEGSSMGHMVTCHTDKLSAIECR